MGIRIEQTGNGHLLALDGVIDISVVAELKAALVDAIGAGENIDVSVEAVTGIDIAAYQLLWAANREAAPLGTRLALAGELPESARHTLAEMGLEAGALLK
jgi:ABC-type transporter Mla MlaB component